MNTKNKAMIDLGNGFVLPVNGANTALARGIASPAPVVTEARVGQALDAAGQPLRGLAERVQAHPLPAPKPFDYNAVQRRRREARLADRIAHDPAYRTRVKGMVEEAEREDQGFSDAIAGIPSKAAFDSGWWFLLSRDD